MNRLTYQFLTTSVLAFTVCAVAQEKKIDRSALPPAVEKTVQAQSQGATVKGFHHRSRERQARLRGRNDGQRPLQRYRDRPRWHPQ